MQSTFSGIEIGKRSLVSHNVGINTVGHNLSNASTDGYSRQRVEVKPFEPLYMPQLNRENSAGQIGQGMITERVERVKDDLLEERIVSETNQQGYWETRDKYILMLERVYNEPTDLSLRTMLDKFWQGWQELSIYPDKLASREAVLRRGELFVDSMHKKYQDLKEIRNMIDSDIKTVVNEINGYLNNIAALNEQITKVRALGDNPNDLMDQRELLTEKLSQLVDINIDSRDPDEFIITTSGYHLLQGRIVHPLDISGNPNNEGYNDVVWKERGEQYVPKGGKLSSLLVLRDQDLRQEIQKIDNLSINMMDLVNEIHRKGYGQNGKTGLDFFTEYPFINNIAGNYDRNGDGQYDSSYVFRITGTNTLENKQQIGIEGIITLSSRNGNTDIPYYSTDTVEDLIQRINNSDSEVVARLNSEGRLMLKASVSSDKNNPDFVIRYIQDSGQFLTGYAGVLKQKGPEGAYNWQKPNAVLSLLGGELNYAVAPLTHPSGWMRINPNLTSDPSSIASGLGLNGRAAETGDGRAALAIANLRNTPVMISSLTTFDDFFANTVADIGLKGEISANNLESINRVMKEFKDIKQSLVGVNIDEELSSMIKFQHGYTAAARFISEVTQMIDTIINKMGV